MKRLWPGWLLCLATAGLFTYMAAVQAPAISAMLGGMKLPDAVVTGYGDEAALALFEAFKADVAAAKAQGRESASAAYVSMHAGSDLMFPPLLALSLGFLAFAAMSVRRTQAGPPRLVSVGLGLVLALAFTYLGCDFIENAVADAMFGPDALDSAFKDQMVFVLQVLTRGKYLSLAVALALIVALWLWRWRSARSPVVDAGG